MIYEALIVPHERPPSLLEIKRALLTYDKVILVDPRDRDLMPSTLFWSSITDLPLGIAAGSVRPMGKSEGYDNEFYRVLKACSVAVGQNLVQVQSTYKVDDIPGGITLGMVQTGGYPLDAATVLRCYRTMAASQDCLNDAIAGDMRDLRKEMNSWEGADDVGFGDVGLNKVHFLPSYPYS